MKKQNSFERGVDRGFRDVAKRIRREKQLTFSTIAQIKKHKFVGNHYNDMAAFAAIQAFARDEKHSIADRAEAFRQMADRGMGMDRHDEMPDKKYLKLNLADES